jgi:phage shock protein A
MGIFSRLFKVGQAEAHAMVNKLEDPIKITEQGIRDLKNDLQHAMTGLAEVKGVSIRLAKEADDAKRQADEYERKAVLLLQRFKDGQLDQGQADRLATEALNQKEITSQRAARLSQDAEQQQRMAGQLQDKVQQLKTAITSYENELVTLRARAKTAESTRDQPTSGQGRLLQHYCDVGTHETESRRRQSPGSGSYGEVVRIDTSVDAEINKASPARNPQR